MIMSRDFQSLDVATTDRAIRDLHIHGRLYRTASDCDIPRAGARAKPLSRHVRHSGSPARP